LKKLALAIDVNDISQALGIVDEIQDKIIIKIGYNLFIKGGINFVKQIKDKGFNIFLDLKLHDIPNTVYNGVKAVSEIGVNYLTIHSLGGQEMIRQAVKAKEGTDLKILAVTILTSHDENYPKLLGSSLSVPDLAYRLADIAVSNGSDGIVCSSHEVKFLKEHIQKPFIAVVPGIRLTKEKTDDQTRIATPEEALKNGADILVVGRPILKAQDRNKIIKEMLSVIGEL
jgi:orotidine-5'-phosphate decarboxylase